MTKTPVFLASLILASASAPFALAQDPAPQAQPVAVPNDVESWNAVSRSSQTVYLVEVNGIASEGGITRARLARVPTTGDAADLSHSITVVEIRCAANQSRSSTETLYGTDGQVEDVIEETYDWEQIAANSLDSYLKPIVCNGDRTTQTYRTVASFITAGRPNR